MKNINKKIALLSVLMLVCSLTVTPAFCEENEEVQNAAQEVIKANKSTLDKAQEAINNKDFEAAINYLNVYINSKPKKYEAYKLRGDAYYALRQYAAAESDYQKAIELKTSNDKLMTGTKYVGAVVLGADKNEQLQNPELGELYAALMYAQKAQQDPAYANAYENAVKYNSHIYLPQPKKSDIGQINCPQKYGKVLNPQGIDADIYGAIDDIEKENYSQAIFKIQNITSNYPDYYMGYYLYGVALVGLEKDEEAISAFEKSLRLNPNDFESLASLGQLYYSKFETTFSAEDSKKSIGYFNKALKYNPNCYIYHFYIGLNELQAGNIDLAISSFDSALKLNPQDYNSMYYKLIAQFNKGNYNSVVNGANQLLYKHVSNYNSVLYLRALANSRLGNYDKAFEDLTTAQNNIEDIYNADIKVVTEKDRALESYIYYLKSEIAHNNGTGAAADREKAMQNPVIAQLSKAQNALKPYKEILNSDTISLADYKKYEQFYNTGLQKLLQSGIVMTSSDVENQYDYIRTTFDDLGLSFEYANPDYRLTTISGYPYKKYSAKLSQEDFAGLSEQTPQEIKQSVPIQKAFVLPEQTPQSEMIADETKPSLAQMLATNQLANRVSKPQQEVQKIPEVAKGEAQGINIEPQTPDAEKVNTSSNIAAGEPFIYTQKPSALVNKDNDEKLKEIIKEEKADGALAEPEIKQEIKDNGNIKISAQNVAKTPDIVIKYNDAVTEKHADVNPADFGVKPSLHIPEIRDDEEIIELEPKKELKTAMTTKSDVVKSDNVTETTVDKVVNSSFDGAKTEIKNVQERLSQAPAVVLPEISEHKEDTIIAAAPVAEAKKAETAAKVEEAKKVEEVKKVEEPVKVEKTDEVATVVKASAPVETVTPIKAEEQAVEVPVVVVSEIKAPSAREVKDVENKIADISIPEIRPKENLEQISQQKAQEIIEQTQVISEQIEEAAATETEISAAQQKAQEALFDELAKKVEAEQKLREKELRAQEKLAKQQVKAEEKAKERAHKEQQALELKAKQEEQKAQLLAKKAEEKANKEAQKIELAQRKAEEKAKALEKKALAEQQKAELKKQRQEAELEAKAALQEKKAQALAQKKAQEEQLRQQKEQAEAELKAKKELEKEQARVHDEEYQAKIDKLKEENIQLKKDLQLKKENEKAAKQAAKEQLRQDRAEAQRIAKERKAAAKAKLKAQKEAQKAAREAQIKAQKEKQVSNVTKTKKKFSFKDLFKKKSEVPTEKTVIKSLSK